MLRFAGNAKPVKFGQLTQNWHNQEQRGSEEAAKKPDEAMAWLMGNHSITVKPSIGAGLRPVATRRRVATSVALLVPFRSKFEAARLM